MQLRVGPSLHDLRFGRLGQIRASIEGVELRGLVLACLAIHARDARLVPGWPPRLRTGLVRIRAEIHQPALDTWTRSAALPIRLRLRSGGLAVRAGLAGVRLAEVRAAIEIDRGLVVVSPSRGEVLGVGLSAPPIRFPLPIPALPRGTRLVGLEVGEGQCTVELELPSVDEPINGELIRRAWQLRPPGYSPSGRSGTDHGCRSSEAARVAGWGPGERMLSRR